MTKQYNMVQSTIQVKCCHKSWKTLLPIYTVWKLSKYAVFSRILTEYRDILCISPYSVRMREDTDQKKLCISTLFTQWLYKPFLPHNKFHKIFNGKTLKISYSIMSNIKAKAYLLPLKPSSVFLLLLQNYTFSPKFVRWLIKVSRSLNLGHIREIYHLLKDFKRHQT